MTPMRYGVTCRAFPSRCSRPTASGLSSGQSRRPAWPTPGGVGRRPESLSLSAKMTRQGHEPIAAAIGPGIGPCCFEVGPDVAERFPQDLTETRWGATSVDLAGSLRRQLEGLEVWLSGACTMHETGFYSHRRPHRAPQRHHHLGGMSYEDVVMRMAAAAGASVGTIFDHIGGSVQGEAGLRDRGRLRVGPSRLRREPSSGDGREGGEAARRHSVAFRRGPADQQGPLGTTHHPSPPFDGPGVPGRGMGQGEWPASTGSPADQHGPRASEVRSGAREPDPLAEYCPWGWRSAG